MNEKGIDFKYDVFQKEGGEQLYDCFVLRPLIDPVARKALHAYAMNTENMQLSMELVRWLTDMSMHIGFIAWFEFQGNIEFEEGDVFMDAKDRHFKVLEKQINVLSENMKNYKYRCELIDVGLYLPGITPWELKGRI